MLNLSLQFKKDQKPMNEETAKIIIQSRFFPTPIIPPNLTRRVFVPICNSEIVCSTKLSNVIPNPDFFFVA